MPDKFEKELAAFECWDYPDEEQLEFGMLSFKKIGNPNGELFLYAYRAGEKREHYISECVIQDYIVENLELKQKVADLEAENKILLERLNGEAKE